ncbi:MAG: hypothetical protein HDR03_06820 [Lachnospiraceae bacterium]|nr:hypothetical protein [Lachnospiraceae bacterium]
MIQIMALIFWLLVIPFCIGLIPAKFTPDDKRNAIATLLAGYLLMWSVFEAITIPAVIWIQYDNFLFVLRWFMIAAILLAAFGIIVWYMDWKKTEGMKPWFAFSNLKLSGLSIEAKIEWILFLALAGFQLYMAVTRASFDGDDAYYVVESLMAQQSNAMYKNLPYTGRSSPLDMRHALAVFPIWIAFVAVKANLHATIVSHVVMPLILIPLSYMTYYEIAKALFAMSTKEAGNKSCKENIPVFMIIMAMFQMFGNVSIYTNETFFLTRTWQGKSVTANLVIPMMFLLMLWLFAGEKNKEKGRRQDLWIMLVCLNMTAGICSSLAVFLIAILLGATALCLMLVEKDWKIPVKLGLTCIPNLFYVILYLGLIA